MYFTQLEANKLIYQLFIYLIREYFSFNAINDSFNAINDSFQCFGVIHMRVLDLESVAKGKKDVRLICLSF